MKRAWALALQFALALLALAKFAGADGDADLRRLFPARAPIEAGDAAGAVLWRLELPAPVLAACRADLSDLRIIDARGQVVPFVIDAGEPPRASASGIERRPARVLAAGRRQLPRRADAAARWIETFELDRPPPASAEGVWQLVIEADAPEFVRQLAIEALGPHVPRERVVASLFRIRGLADQGLSSPLPALPFERLGVQIAGEESFPLRPRFFFEARRQSPAPRVLIVPLAVASVESSGSERRFLLERPPGIVPSTLRLETPAPAFERRVEVFDVARGRGTVRIGRANVFRMPLDRPIEGLELELAPASGQTLEVRIDDGDSPPLADLTFSAVVRAPSLMFAPPAEAERGLTLYFGGGRARAPRYDLGRLLSERADPQAARGVPVRLGTASENPAYVATPPLAFATRPGAPVDARLYTHQRALAVTASSQGLVRVALSPADLGVLRPDLGDVRIVDAGGHQWPYLVDSEPSFDSVPLELRPAERRGTASHLPLALPTAPLAASALVLDASDAYFDRAYRLVAQALDGQSIELARGRLQRDPSAGRQPIVLPLSPERISSLALEVEDGDDASLRWTGASLRVDVPRLYVLAEPGAYRLLLGNGRDTAPSYDVAGARELILSVAFQDTSLGPLAANPDYRTSARLAAGDAPSRVLLWVVLSVAVAALGVLTLRMVRQGQTPAG